MKRIVLFILFAALGLTGSAQTATFSVTTTPCNNDGVLTANFTALTPPLTVTWTTYGSTGATIVHSGVSGLSDALTSYSGGPVYISATDGAGTANAYFNGAPPFTYHVSTTTAVCPALGTASVSVTGGTAPYSYQWFDAATLATVGTTDPVSLPGGNYGITITDASGCVFGSKVNPDSVSIYSIAPFSVPVTSTIASCTNGSATVGTLTGGTTPYSYLWSNGATTASIGSLTMGSYNCVVTDAAGCYATGYAYVSQSITITAPVTPTPATCLSANGAVIAFGSGGTPPYSYLWSNGATTQSQTGLVAGYYSVGVVDANGCIGSGGGSVTASTPITVTYTASSSLCTSATGAATITPTGGTSPYTINWYTTPPQTGATATALAPGTYYFHVTDAVGCIRNGSVPIAPVDVISASFSTTSALCTTASGGATVYPSGGVTPYSYLWNTGATSSSLSSVAGGGYNVTITDAMSCKITKSVGVPVYSPVGVGISGTPASCIFTNDGSLTAIAWGGTLPYTYSWGSSTITGLHYGSYWLSVSDATGCTANDYAYLGYNASATSCYCTINGTVFDDVNGNCIQDAGEAGIPHIQIYCSGIGYTYTDASGHYSFIVPSGSYTISETILAFYPLATCQLNNIPVTAVAAAGCVHTVNFANSINPIHDMHISTWDYNYPIPGHTYTQATIMTNNGTVTESAPLAGYNTDGQVFAPTFIPGGIFSGAAYSYSSGTSFPSLAPGFSEHFYMDYIVPTDIPLGTNLVFKDSVANVAPMSNWLTDYSPWDNVNYFTTGTISSYDPNFKEVSPKGTGPTGIIHASDSVLEYMVHFQNTGTAPAENIVVIDTLDNNLDWTSLRPVFESSPSKITLTQTGTVKVATFTFDDINLPTATSDPVRSNGMFTYTIKTIAGLPVGSTFKNNASIYFDYNAPIKTNTTLNTLGATTAVSPVPTEASHSFTIYPNPASQDFNAVINSTEVAPADMKVCDVTGKVLITKTISVQKGLQTISTNVNQLTPGIYFVSLIQNGNTQTQKLVIMK